MAWLTQIDSINVSGVLQTLYVSAGLQFPVVDGQLYEEVAETVLSVSSDIFNDFGAASGRASTGEVRLTIDQQIDEWRQHRFRGVEIRVYEGEGESLAGYTLRFKGTIDGATFDVTSLSLRIRDAGARLDRNINAPKFDGLGGLGGTSDLQGVTKPLAFGRIRALDPTQFLIDPQNLVYMLSHRGVQAVTQVTDGGNQMAFGGDFNSLQSLIDAPLNAGQYATSLAWGLIRIGGRPSLKLAVFFQGDNAGGYVERPGALIRRVLDDFASLDVAYNASELTALDAGHPHALGLLVRDEQTAANIIETFAVAAGAFWRVDRLGVLRAGFIAYSAPSVTITNEEPEYLRKTQDNEPVKSWSVTFAQTESIHSAAEVASLTSADIIGLDGQLLDLSLLAIFNEDAVIQNAFLNHQDSQGNPYFVEFTSGWQPGTIIRGGQERRALILSSSEDRNEILNQFPRQNRLPGSRITLSRFANIAPQERIDIAFYGERSSDANGIAWVGVVWYDINGNFLSERFNPNKLEPAEAFGRRFRALPVPSRAAAGEVILVVQGRTSGTWSVTGFVANRLAPQSNESVLNMADAPRDANATQGADIGDDVRQDGEVVDASEILTADGQLTFNRFYDFDGDTLGWTANNLTLEPLAGALRVTTAAGSSDPQLISPDDLNVDGSQFDKIAVRMRRVALNTTNSDLFENMLIRYATDAHGFVSDYRRALGRKFNLNTWRTVVFDMAQLSAGGDDWITSIINQIRFDPAADTGDVFDIDWIGIGRVVPGSIANPRGTLADALRFVELGASDSSDIGVFGAEDLADMGLTVGDQISASCEILTPGTRTGQLEVIFERDDLSDIEAHTSTPTNANQATYQQKNVNGRTIPPGCTTIRFRLLRRATGAGTVAARRLTIVEGARAARFLPVRSDVEEGANKTTNTSQLVDGAGLGQTATWSNVGDDDGNRPADRATVGGEWNGNIVGQPNDADISNNGLVLNTDGTLSFSGTGGPINLGGVTASGLGVGPLGFLEKAGFTHLEDFSTYARTFSTFGAAILNPSPNLIRSNFTPDFTNTDGREILITVPVSAITLSGVSDVEFALCVVPEIPPGFTLFNAPFDVIDARTIPVSSAGSAMSLSFALGAMGKQALLDVVLWSIGMRVVSGNQTTVSGAGPILVEEHKL